MSCNRNARVPPAQPGALVSAGCTAGCACSGWGRSKDGGPRRWAWVAGSCPVRRQLCSDVARERSLYQKRQNQTPTHETPQSSNRKQGLDKNTFLPAAAAPIAPVSEGHALDRKLSCLGRLSWGWGGGAPVGREVRSDSRLSGLCAPHFLAGEDIEPDLPTPLLARMQRSTSNVY